MRPLSRLPEDQPIHDCDTTGPCFCGADLMVSQVGIVRDPFRGLHGEDDLVPGYADAADGRADAADQRKADYR